VRSAPTIALDTARAWMVPVNAMLAGLTLLALPNCVSLNALATGLAARANVPASQDMKEKIVSLSPHAFPTVCMGRV